MSQAISRLSCWQSGFCARLRHIPLASEILLMQAWCCTKSCIPMIPLKDPMMLIFPPLEDEREPFHLVEGVSCKGCVGTEGNVHTEETLADQETA